MDCSRRVRESYGLQLLWLLSLLATACSGQPAAVSEAVIESESVLVGVEPLPHTYLFEHNSSTLIHWKRAAVRNRIVVHLDGHIDLDWLPDRTVTRLAAANVEELSQLEIHPYAMDDQIFSGFAIYNFIYPAMRMGMVRDFWWVVPDGTLAGKGAATALVRDLIAEKMQGIPVEDIQTLRWQDGGVHGTLYGTPVHIIELQSLPTFEEPVLLDLDMDYFTTVSAHSQRVSDSPWILMESVLDVFQARNLTSDLATICLSSVGGFFPVHERWLGSYLQQSLIDPASRETESAIASERRQAGLEMKSADYESAVRRFERLVELHPEEASYWLGLADARRRSGRPLDATEAFERALELDPLLLHSTLYEADRAWLNRLYSTALSLYESYLQTVPNTVYRAYTLRRRGDCLARLGRKREAVQALQEVIALAPRHGDTRLDLGVLLREMGYAQKGLRQMHAARSILPERSVYALALGTTQLMGGDMQNGMMNLESAIQLQPTMARAHANLAAVYLQLDRLEEAARQVGQALRVAPENAQYRRVAQELSVRGVALPQ